MCLIIFFFFSSRRRHTRCSRDWSSDVCSSDLLRRRTAALVRGYAAVLRLRQAEIMAVPDLLVTRCVGSVFWRAGRWRRGQSMLDDVADRVAVLEATETWLAVHRGQLLSV